MVRYEAWKPQPGDVLIFRNIELEIDHLPRSLRRPLWEACNPRMTAKNAAAMDKCKSGCLASRVTGPVKVPR